MGNWKMNPRTLSEAKKLFIDVRKNARSSKSSVEVVVAPPFPFISEIQRLSPSRSVKIASQDAYFEVSGAYTGEVSLSMLRTVGVDYVIVGHSERRALGDSDEEVQKTTAAVLKSNMTAIVCVGEKKRDSHGSHFGVVEGQLKSAIQGISKAKKNHLVIAYEPVWAIGTGKNATADDVLEMKLFIQKVLTDSFGRTTANAVRILYGGSVKQKNAEEILQKSEVDGFLIGGASLRASEFNTIVKMVRKYE